MGRLLVLDHQHDPPPRGDAIMFVYDGGLLEGPTSMTLPAAELASCAFVAPSDLDERVIPRLARRIRWAIEARREGRVVELGNGLPRRGMTETTPTSPPNPPRLSGVAPRLEAGEFFLDGHRVGDAAAMLAGDDPESVRWLNEGHVSSLEQNRSGIARWQESWRTGGAQRTWALRETSTGDLAGGCELRLEGSGIADFSYWIYPAYRGRGWAARGLTLVVAFAFAQLDIARATLLIEGENTASHRVAATAGFRREGVLRSAFEFLGTRDDAVSYSRLPSDPPGNPAAAG